MSKSNTLCKVSLVSIVLILLLVSSAALAATGNNTGNATINTGNATIKDNYVSSTALEITEISASPKITETQITTNGSAWSPAIYGNRIVYSDNRNGNYDIYMYDFSTKKETQITTNTSDEWGPVIYGNTIVWEDSRNAQYNWEIYMYDLSTKKEKRITTSGSASNPAIYGDRIVWMDDHHSNTESDIYLYSIYTSEEIQITTDTSTPYSVFPVIHGDKIVWTGYHQDGDYVGFDIYMYDLSTSKETQITNDVSVSSLPVATYGDRIVWSDRRNGNGDIYMYNLSTKKETQITSSPDWQVTPVIYGNRIVWQDEGGEDDGWHYHGIYMYDISTNQKMKISTSESAGDPAIYGNNVVWEDRDDRNNYGNYDIYMGTISNPEPKPPVAALSASPTSGKAPLKVQFTDKSTGTPTIWKWSFGDGKYSTEKNPAHTYSKAGKYTVSLTVKNAAGSNTLKKSSYINAAAPLKAPIAAFSASPRSGKAPLKVQFTDKSANSPTSWKWSFGDGTYSTTKNPAHTYSKAGKYTVSLTVKNAKGSNTKTMSGYIIISKK